MHKQEQRIYERIHAKSEDKPETKQDEVVEITSAVNRKSNGRFTAKEDREAEHIEKSEKKLHPKYSKKRIRKIALVLKRLFLR